MDEKTVDELYDMEQEDLVNLVIDLQIEVKSCERLLKTLSEEGRKRRQAQREACE